MKTRTSRPVPLPLALLLFLALGLLPLAAPAAAQVIGVKTVPVASGDQFLVHPATTLGMGGVTAAVHDTVGDPFRNPATGARIEDGRVVASPTFYTVTEGNGAAGTLPVALLFSSDSWFGGVSLAIQELRRSDRPFRDFVDPFPGPRPRGDRLSDRSAANSYAAAYAGRELGDGWSVGGGIRWAGLGAVDGVEHLYGGARRIEQSATAQDYRLGLVRDDPDGGSVEAVLVHRRWDATHDVTSVDFVPFPPETRCVTAPCGEWRAVEERNLDRTNTTGVHLGLVRPLEAPGWRVGGFVTVNRKDHPKIPNYDLMNILRDPGTTWAWNLGLGTARTVGETTVGVDAVFEPIWSETWAEAEGPVPTVRGDSLRSGERTVDNDFFFRNFALHLGGARSVGPGRVELGLAVRSISYELEQIDHVERRRREQRESWMEWTPTWGGSLRLDALTLRYQGRLTTGTGRPGIDRAIMPEVDGAVPTVGSDVVLAPEGPLTLQDARVWTHRLSVELPIG